jgi:hypothetical protein
MVQETRGMSQRVIPSPSLCGADVFSLVERREGPR